MRGVGLSSIAAVIFCAGIAIAICVGIFAGSTPIRMRAHREAIMASRPAK